MNGSMSERICTSAWGNGTGRGAAAAGAAGADVAEASPVSSIRGAETAPLPSKADSPPWTSALRQASMESMICPYITRSAGSIFRASSLSKYCPSIC